MARKKRSASIESADEAAINPAPSTAPKKKGRAASVKSVAVKSKFSNKITTPFAEKGLKSPFPDAPQGDGLINQQEGFTLKYRTPINAGGAYIKMENFNQIINETQKALKETQEKCVTSVNGSAADETGNVAIDVSGLVKSVNETLPDISGNVSIDVGVKSWNSIVPDEKGDIKTPYKHGYGVQSYDNKGFKGRYLYNLEETLLNASSDDLPGTYLFLNLSGSCELLATTNGLTLFQLPLPLIAYKQEFSPINFELSEIIMTTGQNAGVIRNITLNSTEITFRLDVVLGEHYFTNFQARIIVDTSGRPPAPKNLTAMVGENNLVTLNWED